MDDRALNDSRVRDKLKRTPDMEEIAAACNAFYWKHLKQERDSFYTSEYGRDDTARKLSRLFVKRDVDGTPVKTAEGKQIIQAPAWPRILLRTGRFSQFESLSLDGVRCGHRPQKRGTDVEWIREPQMGWTRNLCDMGKNHEGKDNPRLPFGWLLLELQA